MINYTVVCIISYHAAIFLLQLDCSVYLCNSCNVVSYKAVTVVLLFEHRRNRDAVHILIEIQKAYAI